MIGHEDVVGLAIFDSVYVGIDAEQTSLPDPEGQLLPKLPSQGIPGMFAELHLASGELPQTRQGTIVGSPGHQDFRAGREESEGDEAGRFHGSFKRNSPLNPAGG